MTLEGRTAVVTGGGQGIGEAVAEALAEAGATVLVAGRTAAKAESVAARLAEAGRRAFAATCDVTLEADVESLAREAADRLGPVDVLINNAGMAGSSPLRRTTLEEWDRLLAVNATGTFLCTRAFLPAMVERGWGRVVNIASVAGLTGGRYIAAYAASKHAMIGLTRSAAAEAGGGVTVNAVCPGYVDTPMTRGSVATIMAKTGRDEGSALAAMLGTMRQTRLIRPDEVVHAVLALCDPAADAINGQAIVVDGGGLLA